MCTWYAAVSNACGLRQKGMAKIRQKKGKIMNISTTLSPTTIIYKLQFGPSKHSSCSNLKSDTFKIDKVNLFSFDFVENRNLAPSEPTVTAQFN